MTMADRSAEGGEPARYFFVHLQKTGGTALFQRLRDCFGPAAVYPSPDDDSGVRSVTDVEYLSERYLAQRDVIRVVTGHFPLCATEALDGPFRTFTLLRDPVERTLSVLRRRSIAEARFAGRSLEEIYEDPAVFNIVQNHMTKMLSLARHEMTKSPLIAAVNVDGARLDVAKQNLEHRVDEFGVQERFEEFCGNLEARFGWDLGPPRFANRTPSMPVPASLRERIAYDNRFDAELYVFATHLLDERAATA